MKVLDFGISKLVESSTPGAPRITETQAVFGSPTYMSPEQVRSAKNVTGATDVWALGVVLHELVSAALPFGGENVAGVLASVMADAPPPLRSLRADVPQEVEALVLRCLEKNLDARITLDDLVRGLTPFASPAGERASAQLLKVAAELGSIRPAPASAGDDPFGTTVRNFTSSSVPASLPARRAWGKLALGIGLGAALVVAAFVAVVIVARPHRTPAVAPLVEQIVPVAPAATAIAAVAPPASVATLPASAVATAERPATRTVSRPVTRPERKNKSPAVTATPQPSSVAPSTMSLPISDDRP